MTSILPFLVGIAAIATLAVLLYGVFTFASGKDTSGRKSNKLMQARVLAQFITVVLALIFLAVVGAGR